MPRLSIGLEQVFTNLGIVGNGYKLFFFDTGTMTPKTTYSNEGLTIQNTNPVVLNSAGRPDVDIWGSDPSLYRMILGTPDSVIGNITTVVDVDPVDNYSVNNIAGLTPIPTAYWGTTAGTSSNYTLDPALVDITSYSNEQTFFIDFHTACAADPDIDINDLGALDLKKKTGQGTKVGLLAGDVNGRHICSNDGTDIIVHDPRTVMTYLGAPPTISVSSNTLTLTNAASSYNVNTGSGAQTINSIDGLTSGQTATIGISSNSNAATFTSGVGNVINPYGVSSVLNSVNDKITVYNDGTNNIIISSGINRNFLASKVAAGGYSYLPNGIIIQWGLKASVTSAGATVTLPIAFPNAILRVVLSPTASANVVAAATTFTTTTFVIDNAGALETRDWQWVAIGY